MAECNFECKQMPIRRIGDTQHIVSTQIQQKQRKLFNYYVNYCYTHTQSKKQVLLTTTRNTIYKYLALMMQTKKFFYNRINDIEYYYHYFKLI